jgi:2-C-methyl-D-erythritol 4-phosphate cytidylyltransferase
MKTVIITAGGIGKRMGGDMPKQFLLIDEKPILMHSIQAFHAYDSSIEILVTLPEDWKPYWSELIKLHQFNIKHQVISGGVERFHSIQIALQQATGQSIAVHDGVRPLVSQDTIARCFEAVTKHKAVVPFLPIAESVRYVGKKPSKSVLRSDYVLVQTPQVFDKNTLLQAYQQEFHAGITDDASLVEESGVEIHLVDGNPENIKITRPIDLEIAQLLIQRR